MKRDIKILFGCVIAMDLLLFTTDSCLEFEEPDPVGTCFIDCSCGDCGNAFSLGGITEKKCKEEFNDENAKNECTCGCSWNWVPI